MKVLVTGGSGFIGSTLVRQLLAAHCQVFDVDKLTYAVHPFSSPEWVAHEQYRYYQVDVCNSQVLYTIFADCEPQLVLHLAAEAYVDKSISAPENIVHTNIIGAYQLLVMAWHRTFGIQVILSHC